MALGRAVVEGDAERVVALAEHHPLGVGGDQGAGDAHVLSLAEVVVRVAQAEGEAEHRGDGGQSDVALAPVEAHPQLAVALEDLAAAVIAPASEPAFGPVSAKHGMSVPSARRGR